MKLLIDMNLSPIWAEMLSNSGLESVHWSKVGRAYDLDIVIFDYAKKHSYIVFTHDLDFGAILAATNSDAPSVIQLRNEDIFPTEKNINFLLSIFQQFENELQQGALLTVNKLRTKIRILPIKREGS